MQVSMIICFFLFDTNKIRSSNRPISVDVKWFQNILIDTFMCAMSSMKEILWYTLTCQMLLDISIQRQLQSFHLRHNVAILSLLSRYFHAMTPSLKCGLIILFLSLLLCRYFHGNYSVELHSLVSPVHNFITTRCHATSIESNNQYFPRIPNVARKFHSNNAFQKIPIFAWILPWKIWF